MIEILQECPLCGQGVGSEALNTLGIDSEILSEMRRLRDEHKLTQAVFLAIKIVRTVQDNPQWMRELLEEQTRTLALGFKDTINHGNSEVLKALYELTGNPLRGKIQETSIAKRLKATALTDSFTTENSTRKGEDVECTVLDNNDVAGIVVVESKRVKSWNGSFIEQVKSYMSKKETPFGIIATTAMPSDALSDSMMIEGVLVVKVDNIDIAYLFMRQYLLTRLKLEREYQSRLSQLEIGEQVLQELRDAVNRGELDELLSSIPQEADAIDTLVNNSTEYIRLLSGKIKKKTDHIRSLITKLMADHIGVIRAKLESKTTRENGPN